MAVWHKEISLGKFVRLRAGFLFSLLTLISLGTETWSSSSCELNIKVTNIGISSQPNSNGQSTDGVFNHRNSDDPFKVFALKAEADLREAAIETFCTHPSSSLPVFLNIAFLELKLATSQKEIYRVKRVLDEAQGSYVGIETDRDDRSISATVIWNPRRMLRDQLILSGWVFDEDVPLLPFDLIDFNQFIEDFNTQVLWANSIEDGAAKRAELSSTTPNDLFGLILNSPPIKRTYFGHSVNATTKRMIVASQFGYSAMTTAAIKRKFVAGTTASLQSISDTDDEKIRRSYNPTGLGSYFKY